MTRSSGLIGDFRVFLIPEYPSKVIFTFTCLKNYESSWQNITIPLAGFNHKFHTASAYHFLRIANNKFKT
jgi:hypothetical protein